MARTGTTATDYPQPESGGSSNSGEPGHTESRQRREGETSETNHSEVGGDRQYLDLSTIMGGSKVEIEKFDGTGDFGIWKRKVRALMAQQRLLRAIDDPERFFASVDPTMRSEVMENAIGCMLWNLTDNVIRDLSDDDDTAIKVWNKLEFIYQQKNLGNKIYLKENYMAIKWILLRI